MDFSRISFGEMVAGVSGLALIFIMFVFSWFGYDGVPDGANAWEWMSFLDIVLFLCALVPIAVVIFRANGAMPQLAMPPGQIVLIVGAFAVVIILFRLIFPGDGPLDELAEAFGGDPDSTRKVGAFLGLIAAGGIAFGGFTSVSERASGEAPPAPPPAPAA